MNRDCLLFALPNTPGAFSRLGERMPFSACLTNGMELPVPETACERLLFVMQGEVDCTVGTWPLRLTVGGWIALPAGMEAVVHAYRSVEDVCLLLFPGKGVGSTRELAFGNAGDMPTAKEGLPLFGFENGILMGQLLPEGKPCQVDGPAVVANMGNTCAACDEPLPADVCVQIPADHSCMITAGKGTVVFREYDADAVDGYKHWMYEACGICWDSGLHHIAG